MLVKVQALLELLGDWHRLLEAAPSDEVVAVMRRHERTGRPLGSAAFVAELERKLGRMLNPQRPGRKRKAK